MKTIYVNQDTLKEAVDYLNNDITFFGFLSHVKNFLKQLLVNPTQVDVDDYLTQHGLDRKTLLNILIDRGVVEKETKILNVNGKDKFSVSYKIPKRNFERKIRRIYISLYEKNEIEGNVLSEDGATSCAGCMQGGGLNPDAGQYTKPFGKVQRRKIYVTNEQYEMLKETGTQDAGDYQYDVPLNFNNGNDPTYNHANIIDSGIPKKKKGIRNKVK